MTPDAPTESLLKDAVRARATEVLRPFLGRPFVAKDVAEALDKDPDLRRLLSIDFKLDPALNPPDAVARGEIVLTAFPPLP